MHVVSLIGASCVRECILESLWLDIEDRAQGTAYERTIHIVRLPVRGRDVACSGRFEVRFIE